MGRNENPGPTPAVVHDGRALTPAQQQLLALRLGRERAQRRSGAIPARVGGMRGPASHSQEALIFLDRLLGPSALYNSPFCFRLRGPLDLRALERTVLGLLERHAALRTRFEEIDGVLNQVIDPVGSRTLTPTRLDRGPSSSPEDIDCELLEQLGHRVRRPFDLTTGPLHRFELIQLDQRDHVLVMVIHHIISDGWSRGVIVRELSELYAAAIEGRAARLPQLDIDFVDFVRWQREQLQGEHLNQLIGYWRTTLVGVEPLALPTDRARPARPTHRGASRSFVVPSPLLATLKKIALTYESTLFIVLLAAFTVWLRRISGQTDIVVGSPVARRDRPESTHLVGYFINTLVLRNDLSGTPTFAALVRRVRESVLEAFAHQELPSDQLVGALGLRGDHGVNPLYQVGFVLQNLPEAPLTLSGLEVEPISVPTNTAKSDLWLSLTEVAGQLQGEFTYSIDLFEESTIERFTRHYLTLLRGIAAAPDTDITLLPLLEADERMRIVQSWNRTARPYPLETGVQAMFEAQVRRAPQATAVVFEGRELNYRELNEHANRLAHRLRELGVRPDALVAVCMDRSIELVIAVLGILKAGGAYLPIDPDYPAERVRFVLADSAASVVLTQRETSAALGDNALDPATTVLCLDEIGDVLDRYPTVDPQPATHADDIAYAIYTSGSTGQPKGVLIPHRGLTNHVLWLHEQLRFTASDRVLQKTSISFDASVWEFVAPLAAGSVLMLARPGGHADSHYLVQTLRAQQITILQLVPSLLRALVEEPGIETCTALRYVVSGGEVLDAELARRFLSTLPAATLGNFYGASEASDDTTFFELREPPTGTGAIPIGRPMANAQCHVLDARLQPVPIGVTGELYIGGAGLARGYLRQPQLTAERFIASPFRAGERLYRTGDLARYLADGEIEYVGRSDHQIKLRGFRIELGEIESLLRQYPGVSASVVMVHGDRPERRQLLGYVTGQRLESAAISGFLRERLPPYMVPAFIYALEAFPLLPNGKLDRRLLPLPDPAREQRSRTPPDTPTEHRLHAIWSEVLGTGSFGVDEDFFALGGHSLLAMQIAARVRSQLGVDVPLRELLDAASVRSLSRLVDHASEQAGRAPTDLSVDIADATEREALEAALAGIWASVLEVDVIEPTQTFAGLGGNGEQAGMLLELVESVFAVEFTQDDLHGRAATARAMAGAIAAYRADGSRRAASAQRSGDLELGSTA